MKFSFISECKYTSINALRGIFALLIVWHHFAAIFNIPYYFDFGNSIVLFFFILSGFHIALTWKDKIEGNEKTFMLKRISKIFPLHVLITLIYVVLGINLVSLWAIPFHFTLTQSLIPFWEINFTLNTPSWFLSSLFICYLCTPLLLNFARLNVRKFIFIYFSALTFYLIFLCLVDGHIGLRWIAYINPVVRLFDYSLGIILGLLWDKGYLVGRNDLTKYASIFEIGALLLFFLVMRCEPIVKLNSYTALRYPIVLLLIIVFTLNKGYISRILSNKLFNWIGSLSMSIYMIQGIILYFVHLLPCMDISITVILVYGLILLFSYFTSIYFNPFMGNLIMRGR